jgi:hypothetical protein
MINDAHVKKKLETLLGCGLKLSRAKMLSKIKPGSGILGGLIFEGSVVRAYSVFAAPSRGRTGLLSDPSAERYAYLSPTYLAEVNIVRLLKPSGQLTRAGGEAKSPKV